MPRIFLKPNSPEFEPATSPVPRTRRCEMPGCHAAGEHRAPRDRSLSSHYWFCLPHVQEYNAAWNFFSGMAPGDVEATLLRSLYGDRPTWRSDSYRGLEAELKRKIRQTYDFDETDTGPDDPPKARPTGTPYLDALAVFDLDLSVDFNTIRRRYRELVKKYHPDHHHHDPRAEEMIKQVNMAYTILKLAYLPYDRQDNTRPASSG